MERAERAVKVARRPSLWRWVLLAALMAASPRRSCWVIVAQIVAPWAARASNTRACVICFTLVGVLSNV